MALIPLHNRAGVVVAHAIVDAEDFERFGHLKWGWSVRYVRRARRVDEAHDVPTQLHRAILGLRTGDPRQGEHVDRNRLNNRRSNLRVVAGQRENQQNRDPSGNAGSSSQYRGVYWNGQRQRWVAQAMLDGRNVYIGSFTDEHEAGRASAEWRAAHMPLSSFAQVASKHSSA